MLLRPYLRCKPTGYQVGSHNSNPVQVTIYHHHLFILFSAFLGLETFFLARTTRNDHTTSCTCGIDTVMSDDSQAQRPRDGACSDSTTDTVVVPDPHADVADNRERSMPSRSRRRAATHDIHVQVEAFGSGVLLHDGLTVSLDATVADLRQLVRSSARLPPRTRTMRLFVGHGGAELSDDDAKLAAIPALAAGECDGTPLVVFPTLCTYHAMVAVACMSAVMTTFVDIHAQIVALTLTSLCAVGRARSRRAQFVWLRVPRDSRRCRGQRRPRPRSGDGFILRWCVVCACLWLQQCAPLRFTQSQSPLVQPRQC